VWVKGDAAVLTSGRKLQLCGDTAPTRLRAVGHCYFLTKSTGPASTGPHIEAIGQKTAIPRLAADNMDFQT
jgi:hypothetical protein